MSHLNEETPTVHLTKKVLFAPEPAQPSLDDRAFAVTGGCDLGRLTAMVKYIEATHLFARVIQAGIIVRIILLPEKTWEAPLNFSGEGVKQPLHLAAVREQLKEDIAPAKGDATTKKEDLASTLAYVVALLWQGAGWGAEGVSVEESPIGLGR